MFLLLFQSQVVSDPLKLSGDLDSLVLGRLQVFGVPLPPLYVLANEKKVSDFSYQADTKVSFSISNTIIDSYQLGRFYISHVTPLTKKMHVYIYIHIYIVSLPQVLTVKGLDLPMSEVFTVQWAF